MGRERRGVGGHPYLVRLLLFAAAQQQRQVRSLLADSAAVAITDPAFNVNAPGWYDFNDFQEIGDLCAYVPYAAPGGLANGQRVQREWSNEGRSCRDHRPSGNVLIEASPAFATVPAGGSATFTVTASAPPSGAPFAGKLKLGFDRIPGSLAYPYQAVFTPPERGIGESATAVLTLAPDRPARFLDQIYIYGLDEANQEYHLAAPSLASTGSPPIVTSVSPATGRSIGGTLVTLSGSWLGGESTVQIGTASNLLPAVSKAIIDSRTRKVTGISFLTPGFPIPAGHDRAPAQILITNADGKSTTASFTYLRDEDEETRPRIISFDLPSAPVTGGQFPTKLFARHLGLAAANGAFAPVVEPVITVGGQVAQAFTGASDPFTSKVNYLWVFVPPGAAPGPADIVVINNNGQRSKPFRKFSYSSFAGMPPVLADPALSVDHGPTTGGNYLTVYGSIDSSSFDPAVQVFFGDVPAVVRNAVPGVFVPFAGVIAPPHKRGVVDVTVVNADGQRATAHAAYRYGDELDVR